MSYCLKLAVPAAVMKWNQEHVAGRCEMHQLRDLGRGDGDGLVDDDALAGLQRLLRHLKVGAAGRCHNDEVNVGIAEEFFEGAVSGDAGITLGGLIGVPLNYGCQLEPVY